MHTSGFRHHKISCWVGRQELWEKERLKVNISDKTSKKLHEFERKIARGTVYSWFIVGTCLIVKLEVSETKQMCAGIDSFSLCDSPFLST
jgi:hypothetical protein